MAPLTGGNCLVFDVEVFINGGSGNIDEATKTDTKYFCGSRSPVYYTNELHDPAILHFDTFEQRHRLLSHFYQYVHFSDPVIDNYYKRFVRDFLHYTDKIFCAAGKIVRSLQIEAMERGFVVDEEGGGGYSSLHIRRGDLQFDEVLISEDRWWDNTADIWKPNEILYISSDEKDKKFFDNFALRHDLRFLEDYWDLANLDNLDVEHLGMIDAIVASRGTNFCGTYFSTFSGYINRMRGYHGMSKYTSWYSWNPVKYEMQKGEMFTPNNEFKREYSIGWVGIDGDRKVMKDNEVDPKPESEFANDKAKEQLLEVAAEKKDTVKGVNTEVKRDDKQHPDKGSEQSTGKDKEQQAVADKSMQSNTGADHGIKTLEESMIKSLGFLPAEDEDLEVTSDGETLYIVFSTDCGAFQHWQSYLLFFSAARIRQPGFITRIASGCTDEQKQEAKEYHQEHIEAMSRRFRIFFTPKVRIRSHYEI